MLFDLKTLKRAVDQIAEEKGIDSAKILEAIESSIAAAYKKEYCQKGELIKCKFDIKTGDMKFWQVKTVVDETTVRFVEEGAAPEGGEPRPVEAGREEVGAQGEILLPRYNEDRHILVADAQKIKDGSKVGDELEFALVTKEDFGRIAAQTAKQVILQRLREAERDAILGEFKTKEGEIVSGVVQRFDRGNVYIDLGRTVGVLFFNETIPGEHYRAGERMRFYVTAVQADAKTPGIILSRAHPKFVAKLFAMEVPEINDGVIEIKALAREPGSRTKIAVISKVDGVDPVGSCVGQRGTRVMAVSNELGQEKLDIVEWSEDPAKFITNSLSPAKVKEVQILQNRAAKVFIPEDQLSLAIGKGGQNVRLAAKLTGWKIDVRSAEKPEVAPEGGVAEVVEAEKAVGEGDAKIEA
ncbi:MAG: transcription termination factor NusA [bacterium]|nr:transcription termination factor NusA [bacterium]